MGRGPRIVWVTADPPAPPRSALDRRTVYCDRGRSKVTFSDVIFELAALEHVLRQAVPDAAERAALVRLV